MSLTSRDLIKVMQPVSELYGKNLTSEVLNLWFGLLNSYSIENIQNAFSLYLQTESRMPLPADILKILRGSEEDLALAALIKVEKAMSRYGSYSTVVFDDPIIHAVIDELGGWIKCCHVTDRELTWWEKDFRERYRHHLRYGSGIPTDVPSRLLGILDENNLPLGEQPQKPTVIGDYEKAIGWVSKLSTPDSLSLDKNGSPQKIAST
ncbi:MAG: DUF6475 domain-containing protein [Leptospirales bacterium]